MLAQLFNQKHQLSITFVFNVSSVDFRDHAPVAGINSNGELQTHCHGANSPDLAAVLSPHAPTSEWTLSHLDAPKNAT